MKPDFRDVAATTRRYNFHTHTEFCDGRDTMDAMALAALRAGFLHIGFTPHSPVPVTSPCNMAATDVEAYIAKVRALDALYPDMHVYAGMEIDYFGPEWGPASPYFSELPLDYRIGSVHFVPTPDGRPVDVDGSPERFARTVTDLFGGDLRRAVTAFFGQTRAMLAAGGLDIIGHFDKIVLNASLLHPGLESEPWYRRELADTVRAVIDSGVTVEINTKHHARYGRYFPAPELWRTLADAGVTLIVNSDAHYADLLEASRAEAFTILAAQGINVSTP